MGTEETEFLDAVRALLTSTQSRRVPLAEFEPRFLHLHSEMPLSTPEHSAQAIEDLFWVVEEYVAEPALRSSSDPDEHALLEAVGRCLSQLGS